MRRLYEAFLDQLALLVGRLVTVRTVVPYIPLRPYADRRLTKRSANPTPRVLRP